MMTTPVASHLRCAETTVPNPNSGGPAACVHTVFAQPIQQDAWYQLMRQLDQRLYRTFNSSRSLSWIHSK